MKEAEMFKEWEAQEDQVSTPCGDPCTYLNTPCGDPCTYLNTPCGDPCTYLYTPCDAISPN